MVKNIRPIITSKKEHLAIAVVGKIVDKEHLKVIKIEITKKYIAEVKKYERMCY